MSAIIEKVKRFLDSMRLTYEIQPVEGKITRIVVPYRHSEADLEYYVVIDSSEKWVRFWTLILSHEKLKDAKTQEALYQALLVANGELAEVKYFITEKGDVGILGHEGVEALTIDGFREEFYAIPFGITHFLTNIAKRLKIAVTVPSKERLSIYA
ncbi:MAG: hypothetical protein ACFFDP_01045 [Promethearchaeota archaeon]